VPGIYDGVERFDAVKVEALDAEGKSRTIEADGLLAVCIQHEMDHLMGKVFVEYLSPLKRNRIKTKMLKAAARGARLRLVFAGTPEFARVALERLHAAGHEVPWC
jgi:peptide deformylase